MAPSVTHSRRRFLGSALAATAALGSPSTLLAGLLQADPGWEEAKKNPASRQKLLDTLRLGARFFAITTASANSKTTNKLVLETRQLKCHDGSAHGALETALLEHLRLYTDAKKAKPAEAARAVFGPVFELARGEEADVHLDPSLWGAGRPIGLVPDGFWANAAYAGDADRRSRLVDNLGQKAVDISNNLRLSALWPHGNLTGNVSSIWTEGGPRKTKLLHLGLFAARHYIPQGLAILRKVRDVSAGYERIVAERWQNSEEFQEVVRTHLEQAKSGQAENLMGAEWGFKCLPFDGKFVAYDPEVVKKYDFAKQ